jgi:hypothetical protein
MGESSGWHDRGDIILNKMRDRCSAELLATRTVDVNGRS